MHIGLIKTSRSVGSVTGTERNINSIRGQGSETAGCSLTAIQWIIHSEALWLGGPELYVGGSESE